MIISCKECGTNYRLKAHLLKAEGTTVRCSKCEHVFTAYPPQSKDSGYIEKAGPAAVSGKSFPEEFDSGDLSGEVAATERELDDLFGETPFGEKEESSVRAGKKQFATSESDFAGSNTSEKISGYTGLFDETEEDFFNDFDSPMRTERDEESDIVSFGDLEETSLETIGFEDLAVEQEIISLKDLESEDEVIGLEALENFEPSSTIDLNDLTGNFESPAGAADTERLMATAEPDIDLEDISMKSSVAPASDPTEIELADLMETPSENDAEIDLDDLRHTLVEETFGGRENEADAGTYMATTEPDPGEEEVEFDDIGVDSTSGDAFTDIELDDLKISSAEEDVELDLNDLQDTVDEPSGALSGEEIETGGDLFNFDADSEIEGISFSEDEETGTDGSSEETSEDSEIQVLEPVSDEEEEFDLGLDTLEESVDFSEGTEDLDLDKMEGELEFDLDDIGDADDLDDIDVLEGDLDLEVTEEAPVEDDSLEIPGKKEEFDIDPEELSEEGLNLEFNPEDFDLDLEEAPEASGSGVDQAAEDEFDFELDLETQAEPVEDSEVPVDEEFELDLEDEAQPETEDEEDFDLDITLEEDPVEEKNEEIELDLDFDSEDVGKADAGPEEDETPEAFELDFDLEPEEEGPVLEKPEPSRADAEEFDLTDVEELLDLEEKTQLEATRVADDGDFDLSLETVADSDPTQAVGERDFDIELETMVEEDAVSGDRSDQDLTMENMETMESMATMDTMEGPDREIESPEMASPVTESTQIAIEPVPEEEEDQDFEEFEEAPVQKRRRPVLKILLVILLLAAAGAGAYFFYLNNPGVTDSSGKLEIAVATPSYEFIQNEKAGELLVVTGVVTNQYDHPRRHIRVQGNLYDSSGNLLDSSRVYAGSIFEADVLKKQELSEIQSRLTDPQGSDNLNASVMPGQKIPFTVIFSDIPADVEELAVEVIESKKI